MPTHPTLMEWGKKHEQHTLNDHGSCSVDIARPLVQFLSDLSISFNPDSRAVPFEDQLRSRLYQELLGAASTILSKGFNAASVIIAGTALYSYLKSRNLASDMEEVSRLFSHHRIVLNDPNSVERDPEVVRKMIDSFENLFKG